MRLMSCRRQRCRVGELTYAIPEHRRRALHDVEKDVDELVEQRAIAVAPLVFAGPVTAGHGLPGGERVAHEVARSSCRQAGGEHLELCGCPPGAAHDGAPRPVALTACREREVLHLPCVPIERALRFEHQVPLELDGRRLQRATGGAPVTGPFREDGAGVTEHQRQHWQDDLETEPTHYNSSPGQLLA